jgi:hypothetical protein
LQRTKIVVRKVTEPYKQSSEPNVPCAHADCGIAAMCKIKTPTGWANLCWRHYDQHFAQQAVDNLDKYGMEIQPDETRAEHVQRMRLFVRRGIRRMAKGGGRQAAIDAMTAKEPLLPDAP